MMIKCHTLRSILFKSLKNKNKNLQTDKQTLAKWNGMGTVSGKPGREVAGA